MKPSELRSLCNEGHSKNHLLFYVSFKVTGQIAGFILVFSNRDFIGLIFRDCVMVGCIEPFFFVAKCK